LKVTVGKLCELQKLKLQTYVRQSTIGSWPKWR